MAGCVTVKSLHALVRDQQSYTCSQACADAATLSKQKLSPQASCPGPLGQKCPSCCFSSAHLSLMMLTKPSTTAARPLTSSTQSTAEIHVLTCLLLAAMAIQLLTRTVLTAKEIQPPACMVLTAKDIQPLACLILAGTTAEAKACLIRLGDLGLRVMPYLVSMVQLS